MTGARSAWVLALLALGGCGSRTPGGARPAAAAADGGTAELEPEEPPGDGGLGDGGALVLADASLGQIGVAPCESVVGRFLACPSVPEGSKRQLVEAARRWREEAASSVEARERVAATCLEIARMTEEMLLGNGC
jgi:hypothetical protein